MAAANDDTASTAPLISASHEDIARHSEGETDIKPAPPVPNPAPQAADKAEQRQNPKASTSCACKGGGRNLVVCIDGTANQFSYKNTNVVELYSRLIEDENQLTYYNSGIGTYARDSKTSFHYWKQKIDHTIDMAIAWNFKKIVLDAYEWLSENYIPGDRIFLFGFSRGAYQVRVIAGMIELVGLVRKGNKGQIKFAYDLYMDMIGHRHNSSQSERFKRTLCRKGVKVHFVGAWDTVSSIGVARAPSLPETTTGMTHVCAFRHALALDEVRVKFLPEYANAGVGPTADTQAVNVKEVWFSGSHSDIDLNLDLDKFGPALRWMSYEALKEGLRMIDFRGNWQQLKPTNSMRWYWRILECLPFRRLSYDSKKEKEHAVYFPHLSSPRQIMHGQRIHESVIDSPSQREIIYEPFIGPLSQSETFKLKKSERSAWKRRARVPDGLKWDQVIASDDWIERDPYKSANRIVDGILGGNLSDEDCHVLVTLSSSGELLTWLPGRMKLNLVQTSASDR
ncbi:hypothetical protein PUNSTDRAFT_71590 [Punctularia strigosozonata HHB-11173 SS5]|uniref:uncharacterized protein n=1 Tax=Punctularia strigosozonata (strain HHB-11173) TaxID=741275 RepID=UPI0004416461|nr:uncharacterized protein PUNSTDRAFT_71590 [Punctularia strigosozonata HHB-11173 SS5]EIN07509.1 hypothetical protein PUNSTDRAFT_71590 [Punctularia strigosozonata HHB-11173 SS5]